MLHHHRRATTSQGHQDTTPPTPAVPPGLCVILLLIGLGGMVHGLGHGHWLPVAGNAAVMAIAAWGLRLPYRHVAALRQVLPRTGATDAPELPQTIPPSTGTHPAPCPNPLLPEPLINTTDTLNGQLPAVSSFTLNGHHHSTPTGTTAHLSLALPPATKVSTTAVIDVLLTIGHRLLHDHGLADHTLPDVDVTSVDRTNTPPRHHLGTTFTVHISNDLATYSSSITTNPGQPQVTSHQVLLIAATLLAGADQLLDHPHHLLQHHIGHAPHPTSH